MKTNFKFKNLFLILLLGVLCSSCLTNVETPLEEEDPTDCATITFSQNVKPIIDNNCIQCHGSGGRSPNLTTYDGVSANAAIVKAETTSKRMPQGSSLTIDEITAISCWVDAGALNN
jgi:uncharacterized membrane protein